MTESTESNERKKKLRKIIQDSIRDNYTILKMMEENDR